MKTLWRCLYVWSRACVLVVVYEAMHAENWEMVFILGMCCVVLWEAGDLLIEDRREDDTTNGS